MSKLEVHGCGNVVRKRARDFFSIVDVSAELYTHSHNTALVKNTDFRGVW